ncbi:MAG: hypothetical protein ACI935_000087 [Moritella dasanensis]|jgi:hypothetical protein
MNILPRNTHLGKLDFFEIYDDFEGPKCFSVKNNLKQIFFVYWSGDFWGEEYPVSKWLYSPISHERLDGLRRKQFSILDIYLEPELCVYNVEISLSNKPSIVDMLSPEDIARSNLPPNSFYLEPDEIVICANEAAWDFECRIAKASSSSPDSTVVTKVLDALSAVIEPLMKGSTRKRPKLFPLTAAYGSFEVKLGTSDHEAASQAIEQLNVLLSDIVSLDSNLNNLGLDPYKLKDLLNVVQNEGLELSLKPKTYEYLEDNINITSDKISAALGVLNKSCTTFIDSLLVPQASDIDRIIEIVGRIINSEDINFENIEGLSSKRQVEYHLTAAYCLGLLNKNDTVTAAGQLMHHRETREDKYKFLSDRFEASELGWAWVKWSKVDSIYEIDESTAGEFINECVRGLGSRTSKRRASTIATWLKTFKDCRKDKCCEKIKVISS